MVLITPEPFCDRAAARRTEQCFEPYSENHRFSEWVDPDGVEKKETGTQSGGEVKLVIDGANKVQDSYGNLLRPVRLPTRKRRSNVTNP